jgi:hypothetical protein
MWPIDSLIAKCFAANRHKQHAAHAGNGSHATSGTSVELEADMRSCHVPLRSDCSHQEAIAEIEDHLRGRRPGSASNGEHPFEAGRHGIV